MPRCLNIAHSHDLVSAPKNALALLLRAESILSKSGKTEHQGQAASSLPLKLDVDANLTSSAREQIKSLITQHRGLVELHNLNSNSKVAAQKNLAAVAPMIERLNDYPVQGVDLKNLVAYPPTLKPAPVKPIFLDVAWNYIDYPGRRVAPASRDAGGVNGTNDVHMTEDQKPARKGWFGFGR